MAAGFALARLAPGFGPLADGLLVQTGEFDASTKGTDFEVFYPRPYATHDSVQKSDP